MSDLVTYALEDGVARIVMDDGKLNVMSLEMLQALDAAFDRAARDEAIVVLGSAAKVFTAGFDLKLFAADDPKASQAMVRAGAELALKVLSFPQPVVGVCAGHAYPMGAFLLLASDVRIAAEGAWRIGLNEVAIGIAVPSFALEMARQRLTPAYLSRTAVTGEMFGPVEATAAGFFDRVAAPEALDEAVEAAVAALKQIHLPSHATTKARLRAGAVGAVRRAIDAELTVDAYAIRSAEGPTVRLPKAAEPA
jgi:enoyl-CoA hydratase